jgi:hypothetical protein
VSAITWPDVTGHTSDTALTGVPGGAQTAILNYVNAFINTRLFDGEDGYDTKLARIYLAGHMGLGSLPGATSSGGAIVSESGGDGVSVAYAVPANPLDSASETAWGRRYLALARTSCAGPVLL